MGTPPAQTDFEERRRSIEAVLSPAISDVLSACAKSDDRSKVASGGPSAPRLGPALTPPRTDSFSGRKAPTVAEARRQRRRYSFSSSGGSHSSDERPEGGQR